MSTIKVNFEIGHVASLRSKKTPEGFTHDWEVFVRGQEGADIRHFVEKVVFILHDTFPKPKRVVKEPPFSLKESGYAGFMLPIEIYLNNKDEPKKIQFSYDLSLQQSGLLKDRYIFQNPNDDFRKKLLRGGGITINNNAFYTNPDQESRSRDSFSDDKQQLISKPKMSSENKKHKSKEHKEEIPHRTSSFENLFGPPIHKPPKVSPEPKKIEKIASFQNSKEKKDKDRTGSDKKSKHEHKEVKPEKIKIKEEKEKVRSEKSKSHKEQERSKDKSSKRPNERPPSPEANKKRCISPVRKAPSPAHRSGSASSFKDEYKSSKHNTENIEQKKPKIEDKVLEVKAEKDIKEKKKKEKKSHDRDKDRKEKREHKKESHKVKESPKELPKEVSREVLKAKEIPKEKELVKESQPVKEKQPKQDKNNKFSIENLRKTPTPENVDRLEIPKLKDRGDSERKHKHKKKDKKRDESREKHKESNKEKKHKHDKNRDVPQEKSEVTERRETPIPKERPLPEPASPISIDTASQCSSKSGLAKTSHTGNEDLNSSHSDSESSIIAEDEEPKIKLENPSPEPLKHEPSPELEPEPDPEPDPEIEPEPEPIIEPPPHKEKSKKHKDKSSKREEKRRKRKAAEEEEAENRKIVKVSEHALTNNDIERGESSGSTSVETKVQDNGVSSSLGEDAEPGDLSPEYMGQLRDLQKRIMTINNNEDLERVVNLIAETGRYEVTTQTFDFDLCLLDRSTVQQLIQLVGC
ncbi:protein AF-9 [Achroia grisella]|uniref:protein AF-9 n=1 Tax=Achroia grisella TaxID=688607 RepID=UPI0027D1EB9B|nr:protein AF-9 [Achroia grisella]